MLQPILPLMRPRANVPVRADWRSERELDTLPPVLVLARFRKEVAEPRERCAFLDVVDRKPQQHDFRENYQPNRKMVAIGG